jgi:hypothetical protein
MNLRRVIEDLRVLEIEAREIADLLSDQLQLTFEVGLTRAPAARAALHADGPARV